MLAVAAANAAAMILFGALYGAAGAELLSQSAFLAGLAVTFALGTVIWLHAQARHAALPLLRRIARAAIGLLIAAVAVPVLALMPLFWLDTQIPEEAGFRSLLAPAMTVLLIALMLVLAVNVAGTVLLAARALLPARARPSR